MFRAISYNEFTAIVPDSLKGGLRMSKEKQILQCCASGFSQRRTADTLGVSRNTVSTVIAAAKRQHISAQAAELMDEPDLILKLFPEKAFEPTQETCQDS